MPADVIPLASRRAPKAKAPLERHGIAVALQASPGAVSMIVGNSDDGAEVWLSPEEADSLGDDLKRFARAAKGLTP
jgi:hypothetical protein